MSTIQRQQLCITHSNNAVETQDLYGMRNKKAHMFANVTMYLLHTKRNNVSTNIRSTAISRRALIHGEKRDYIPLFSVWGGKMVHGRGVCVHTHKKNVSFFFGVKIHIFSRISSVKIPDTPHLHHWPPVIRANLFRPSVKLALFP